MVIFLSDFAEEEEIYIGPPMLMFKIVLDEFDDYSENLGVDN
jgi:hypothetical protein